MSIIQKGYLGGTGPVFVEQLSSGKVMILQGLFENGRFWTIAKANSYAGTLRSLGNFPYTESQCELKGSVTDGDTYLTPWAIRYFKQPRDHDTRIYNDLTENRQWYFESLTTDPITYPPDNQPVVFPPASVDPVNPTTNPTNPTNTGGGGGTGSGGGGVNTTTGGTTTVGTVNRVSTVNYTPLFLAAGGLFLALVLNISHRD